MHMEKLHLIEETLACLLEAQLSDLEEVDAEEMGEVVDMIKDIEEAKYYCAVVKAMEEASIPEYFDYEKDSRMYYRDMRKPRHHEEDMNEPYYKKELSHMPPDSREGRSPKTRKMYMEAKRNHQEKSVQMKELEKYMQDLASDVIEMVEDASSEERAYLSKKISALATKIQQTNG